MDSIPTYINNHNWFDLDNDGIELISLQNSTTFFNPDADGFAKRTGWVKADDGLLALDRNNNGRIDDTTELFGNATTDGFIILKQLDSNNDNIINTSDAQFANLRIWKDANEDGFTNPGELRSLADWGIQSINLNYQTGSSAINGTGNSLNNTMTGNSGNNILSGDAGNDSLTGGNGNDTLIGGLGNDTLTGSSGADQFIFNASNQGIDTIKDFLSTQGDRIAVSASGFGGGLVAGSSITAAQFVLGSAAADSFDRIIYNISSGALYFDGDGTGSLAAFGLATFNSKPILAHTDIIVIT